MPENKTANTFPSKLLKQLLIFVLQLINRVYRIFTEKDYFNNHHLEISFKDVFNFSIKWYTHAEYIAFKEESLKLMAQETNDPIELIEFALRECRHCTFIIFDCGNEKRFIQYWLGDGKLMADWPIVEKGNDLKKFTYPMLGVLNSLDIHRHDSSVPNKPKRLPYYEKSEREGAQTYSIYFQNYPQDAVRYTEIMLRDVFKGKLEDLNIKIG